MKIAIKFSNNDCKFTPEFGEVVQIGGGGGDPDAYDKGYTAGQQAEYDRFWDIYQRGTEYVGAFAGSVWNANILKPKYDIKPNNASYMFYQNTMGGDLVEYFEKLGRALDFSNCANVNSAFQYSHFARVGKIYSSPNGWYSTFYGCTKLVTIDEFGSYSGGEINGGMTDAFTNCTALENVKVKGIIAGNAKFSDCTKLTHDSLMSIINALKSGTTRTLTLGATNLAKLTDAEKAIATEKGWTLA